MLILYIYIKIFFKKKYDSTILKTLKPRWFRIAKCNPNKDTWLHTFAIDIPHHFLNILLIFLLYVKNILRKLKKIV